VTLTRIWDGTTWIDLSKVGPQGPPGGVEVYEQAAQPSEPIDVGAIWIDTDAPDPTPGTGPAGPQGPQGPTGATGGTVLQTYAVTSGYVKDRSFNPQVSTVNELAAVLATLIDDMRSAGLLQ
jgi:hypothetical protein